MYRGEYAKFLLDNTTVTRYIAVDPWTTDKGEICANIYHSFLDTVKPFMDKIAVIKKDSIIASKDFSDNSLDFVYIDGNHSYECVKEDLNAWWPKVRKGGILAGDDYAHGCPAVCREFSDDVGVSGVDYAVNEFVKEKNLELNLTKCGNINYWIEK